MSGLIQPDFVWLECPECEFSIIVRLDSAGSDECPMCLGDTMHRVHMHARPAVDTDKPEGMDARKGESSS